MSAISALEYNTKVLDAIVRGGGDIEVRHAGGNDIMVVVSTERDHRYGDFQGKGWGTSFVVALDRALKDLAKDMKGEDWEDMLDALGSVARALRKHAIIHVSSVGRIR